MVIYLERAVIAIIGMVFLLMLSAGTYGMTIVSHTSAGVQSSKAGISTVIRINSDAEFAYLAAQNGWSGNGTANNPYIISGYTIDARVSSGNTDGIYIGNTTVYFVIENNTISNASQNDWENGYPYNYGDGIMLYNVTHGIVKNNILINNTNYGIAVYNSTNVTVENNILNNDSFEISYSDNIKLVNNSGHGMGFYGVFMYYSNNVMLYNNTFKSDFGYGTYFIEIFHSKNSTFYNNTIINTGIFLSGNFDDELSQRIPTNNTVNGKPVLYLKNISSATVTILNASSNPGEIILCNVSNVKIENLTITNTTVGAEIGYSSGIIINNCIFGGNLYGICTFNSTNITVNNVSCFESFSGIEISFSSNATIENGKFYNNSYYGICLSESDRIIIQHNLISYNKWYGVYISDSSKYNLIFNNSFYYNHQSGDIYDSSCIQAFDGGSNDLWNTSSYGNYWHEWANNNNTNDQNNNGIVDWPYKIYSINGNISDNKPLKNATYPMPALPPTAPINLTVITGNGYANLTWHKPLGNGSSPIAGYRIYRNGTLIATVPSTQLWFNDTTVINGVNYSYYVTAVNSVGEGFPSNVVHTTPASTVPEFSAPLLIGAIYFVMLLAILKYHK